MQKLGLFRKAYAVAAALLLAACQSSSLSPEPPAGPARYVDVHMHLHPLGLDVTMGGRGRPAGPIDAGVNLAKAADVLVARMDRKSIRTALVVIVPSARSSAESTYQQMRGAIAAHPGRLKLMAGGAILGRMMQAKKPDATTYAIHRDFALAARKILDAGAAGFGEMMVYHLCMNPNHSFQEVAADHPLYLTLADIAAEAGVPIDIHMEAIETQAPIPPRLGRRCSQNPASLEPTIPGLLRHNPGARIVWQHIGWDNTGQMTPTLLRRLLAAHGNLYLALRVPPRVARPDGTPIPNRLVDPAHNVQPSWLRLFQDFPDRFVIGADEFIGPSGAKARIAASFDPTWAMLGQLPKALAEKIGGANARRIYRLE